MNTHHAKITLRSRSSAVVSSCWRFFFPLSPLSSVETGLSITRPNYNGVIGAGEGMEWHSDGAKGEFTVLMSLYDVEENQGSLGIIPGSFSDYREGTGHGHINSKYISDRQIR